MRKEVIVQEKLGGGKKEVIGHGQKNSFQRKILAIPKKVNPLKDGGTKPTGPDRKGGRVAGVRIKRLGGEK